MDELNQEEFTLSGYFEGHFDPIQLEKQSSHLN